MRLLIALLLTAPALAGCLSGSIVEITDLDSGHTMGGPIWMTHTTGCGFCHGTESPWATTLVLSDNRQLMWFSFRPYANHQDDPLHNQTGVVLEAGMEHLRDRLEEAIGLLAADDVYWTNGQAVQVYEVHLAAVPVDDWVEVKQRLNRWSAGLEDAPEEFSYPCEDCGGPNVQVQGDDLVFGIIIPKDTFGNGNVREGGDWDRIERQLRLLHGLVEAQAS